MARCGIGSRRQCEAWVRSGWVEVNGEITRAPETRIDPEQARVLYRGQWVRPPKALRYIVFNKPVGVLCTCHPSREKGPTILAWVKVPERVFPAGRLDRDTSGLIILTNDGELTQRLVHPSFEQEREYEIKCALPITTEHLDSMQQGIMLDDGLSRFLRVERTAQNSVKLTLTEGRNRQIRRTFNALRLPIHRLHRVRYGSLRLSHLPPGRWRDLKPNEIAALKT